MERPNNYAFIDSQNLNLAVRDLGWELDFARFRIYLEEKYHVRKAYLFIGYVRKNVALYRSLRKKGFVVVFKPTLCGADGRVKGNCDAELVLQAMIDYDSYNQAIIVTGDGDFACLVRFLVQNRKLEALIVPNRHKASALLVMRMFRPFLRSMNDLREKLEYIKEKALQGRNLEG